MLEYSFTSQELYDYEQLLVIKVYIENELEVVYVFAYVSLIVAGAVFPYEQNLFTFMPNSSESFPSHFILT